MSRLTRIYKDSVFGGVCTGLDRYTGIDVSVWRLIFILGTLFTTFPFIVAYIILWIILPEN